MKFVKFVWDSEKEKINKRKHKVTFEEACYIFTDKYQLNLFDVEHSEGEDRWITIGQATNNRTLVVVHTFKKTEGKEIVRIISARKASKSEARQYFERKGK